MNEIMRKPRSKLKSGEQKLLFSKIKKYVKQETNELGLDFNGEELIHYLHHLEAHGKLNSKSNQLDQQAQGIASGYLQRHMNS